MNQESMLMQELGVDEQTARQILSNRQLQDTRILQKVNRAHREAFAERYPGQVEHCLRLIMERLQAGLDKRGGVDVARPDTWIITASEIAYLVEAAHRLEQMRRQLAEPGQ